MNIWRKIVCSKKKRAYWSTKCRKLESHEDGTLPTKIKDLYNRNKFLKNEKLELRANTVHNFENNYLTLSKKAQYSNNIKSAYDQVYIV